MIRQPLALELLLYMLLMTVRASGMTDAELYNCCFDNLVYVSTSKGTGTGFVVTDSGDSYIYTCEHCIMDSVKATVRFSDGTYASFKDIAIAPNQDLVRFKLKNTRKGLVLAKSSEVRIGDDVIAYGDSLGGGVMTMHKGKILARGMSRIEVDADVQHGNSGGPVLNRNGQVVGVISSALTYRDALTKGTRFDSTRRFAEWVQNVQWKTITYDEYVNGHNLLSACQVILSIMDKYTGEEGAFDLVKLDKVRITMRDGVKAIVKPYDEHVKEMFLHLQQVAKYQPDSMDWCMCRFAFGLSAFGKHDPQENEMLKDEIRCLPPGGLHELPRRGIVSVGGRNCKYKEDLKVFVKQDDIFSIVKGYWYSRCILECEWIKGELNTIIAYYLGRGDEIRDAIDRKLLPQLMARQKEDSMLSKYSYLKPEGFAVPCSKHLANIEKYGENEYSTPSDNDRQQKMRIQSTPSNGVVRCGIQSSRNSYVKFISRISKDCCLEMMTCSSPPKRAYDVFLKAGQSCEFDVAEGIYAIQYHVGSKWMDYDHFFLDDKIHKCKGAHTITSKHGVVFKISNE